MSFIGETITIGFYDSSTHGNTLATVAPEYLIDEQSFVVSAEGDGVFDWLASDAFGDVGASINFTYCSGPFDPNPQDGEYFDLYSPNESGNVFISPLLFVISSTTGFSSYSPVLVWNNAASTPALPDLFSLGDHIAYDVGGYVLPQLLTGKRVRLQFTPSLFWTSFVRSTES